MRAIIVREHGGLETLRLEELPTPEPGPGQVRVRVRAVGLNHLDVWVRRGVPGAKFPLPIIPGSDACGVVDALGPGVTDLQVGFETLVAPGIGCGYCEMCATGEDHRCRDYGILGEHHNGGCAEFLVVPRANILPKPPRLSFVQAAGIGVPFLTAWHMLRTRAKLQPGETVLVQAAGSGVSSAAIQMAKLLGAKVIATSGSNDKLARARTLGADEVINYAGEDVPKRVKELTGGRGVDVVLDHVGQATWEASVRCMAWHGRLVTCGATTGPHVSVNLQHLFFKSLSLLGSTMGSRGELHEILRHVESGALSPVIDRDLPLSECAQAHQLLEQRRVFGKVVLTP